MPVIYEEIVRNWYDKLRGDFVNLLMSKYKGSKMRLEDAENIYQDIFVVIYDNLAQGRIQEDTSWSSYVMRVGLNIASKQYRGIEPIEPLNNGNPDQEGEMPEISAKVEEKLRELSLEDDAMMRNPEVQSVLGDELTRTPEPCASLIRLHYYGGLKDSEIVEEMPRYGSAASVKVTRNRCMKELIYRVNFALYYAGILDVKPSKDGARKQETKKGGNQ